MGFRESSLVCAEKGHCYDLSKHGYINLAPAQGKTKYEATLFEARRSIFRDGFYDPVLAELEAIIQEHSPKAEVLLDAGCGEGFFAAGLLHGNSPEAGSLNAFTFKNKYEQVFAIDIEKTAILMAAKAYRGAAVKWIVGDLANIPLRDSSADLLLNILAPANYGEFLRVLKPGGLIVKAIPGEGYLRELRELFGKNDYSNQRVADRFRESVAPVAERRLTYTLPVTEAQAADFARMTPLAFHATRDTEHAPAISHITIDMEFLIGRKTA
jgi:23S rRNA (guanine745-N1)-methyltransferase